VLGSCLAVPCPSPAEDLLLASFALLHGQCLLLVGSSQLLLITVPATLQRKASKWQQSSFNSCYMKHHSQQIIV
jgi:hypothetical protein